MDYMKDSWCLADMDRDAIRRLQAQVHTLKNIFAALEIHLLPPKTQDPDFL